MAQLPEIYTPKNQAWWSAYILKAARALGVPVQEWASELNDGRTLVELMAELLSQVQGADYQRLLGFFLEWAKGPFLTAFARGFFQEERQKPEFTEGVVQITNPGFGVSRDIPANDLIVGTPGGSASAKLFRNLDGFSLPKVGQVVEVRVRAVQSGESYNVASGAITDIKTPLPGFVVSNPPLVASGTWITLGGRSEEDDGTISPPTGLKGRCYVKWATIGIGTADGYRYYALAPLRDGGTNPATQAQPAASYDPTIPGFRANCVTVWVAGTAGPISPVDVVRISENFERPQQRYPLDVRVFTRSASGQPVLIEGTVYFYLSAAREEVMSRVYEAIAIYQRDVKIGATVFASETNQRILNAFDEAIQRFEPTSTAPIPMSSPGNIAVFLTNLKFVGVPVQ